MNQRLMLRMIFMMIGLGFMFALFVEAIIKAPSSTSALVRGILLGLLCYINWIIWSPIFYSLAS